MITLALSLRKSKGRTQDYEEEGIVTWTELVKLLSVEGETMSTSDMMTCLTALIGDKNAAAMIGNQELLMDARMFAETVLGFENTENI